MYLVSAMYEPHFSENRTELTSAKKVDASRTAFSPQLSARNLQARTGGLQHPFSERTGRAMQIILKGSSKVTLI